jgi:hypothetical protein
MTRAKAKPTTEPQLSAADRAALELAIETARKHSRADRAQIDDKLRTEPWLTVAMFAAHECQEWSLDLQPWECWPPCAVEVDDDDAPGLEHRGIRKSAALLRHMLALGISRWHPDPVAAIEAAEQVQRQQESNPDVVSTARTHR